jgi:hypothetical protein
MYSNLKICGDDDDDDMVDDGDDMTLVTTENGIFHCRITEWSNTERTRLVVT